MMATNELNACALAMLPGCSNKYVGNSFDGGGSEQVHFGHIQTGLARPPAYAFQGIRGVSE